MKIFRTLGPALALALPLAAVPASAQQQSYGATDYIRQPIRLDKSFQQAFAGGCTYKVRVEGEVTPLPGQSGAKVPSVNPRIHVAAEAVCPNEASVKVADDVLGTGPLTWHQLEDSLSSRSRVFTVEHDHQCSYAADFKLVDARLTLARVAHACVTL
jgi:hypothetical protein